MFKASQRKRWAAAAAQRWLASSGGQAKRCTNAREHGLEKYRGQAAPSATFWATAARWRAVGGTAFRELLSLECSSSLPAMG